MKQFCVLFGLSVSLVASASVPVVSNVTFEQDLKKVVHVHYALTGEPGIVTVECLTNGAAISSALLANASGAVNRLVQPGADNEIVWEARKTFPNQKFETDVSFRVTAWATNCPPPYMAVDLSEANGAIRYYASTEAVPGGVTNALYKKDVVLFKKVTARNVRWLMGTNYKFCWRTNADRVSQAQHHVTLSDDYYMGVYEFTEGQNGHCNGSAAKASVACKPYNAVSYNSLRGASDDDFAGWPTDGHSVKAGSKLEVYRAYMGLTVDLPTEAQWEYSCRAGTTSPYYYAPDEMIGSVAQSVCTNYAWILDNVQGTGVKEVGHWSANPWGFYDLYGNVGEWCLDWHSSWAPASYAKDQIDPVGPAEGTGKRAFRGGHIADGAGYANSLDRRYCLDPSRSNGQCGFRLVCPVVMSR